MRADGEVPASGFKTYVRFRPAPDSVLFRYQVEKTTSEGLAWEAMTDVAHGQVCFQPGLSAQDVSIFEAWSCVSLDDATPYEEARLKDS